VLPASGGRPPAPSSGLCPTGHQGIEKGPYQRSPGDLLLVHLSEVETEDHPPHAAFSAKDAWFLNFIIIGTHCFLRLWNPGHPHWSRAHGFLDKAALSAAGFIDFFGYIGAGMAGVVSGVLTDRIGWESAFWFWIISAFLSSAICGAPRKHKPRPGLWEKSGRPMNILFRTKTLIYHTYSKRKSIKVRNLIQIFREIIWNF